ncbi:hypothetical protein ACWFMI_23355 [Nocardiopsis terrae]|uniref:hypothetical protein n=1 Tax=Streptomyces sp. NPDC057554 TaxID=3350538 RepID=UPI00367A1F45
MSDDSGRRPRPINAVEADRFSEQALEEHDAYLQQARQDSVLDFAVALAKSFARAQELQGQERERRRAKWEASAEGIAHRERVRRNRSEGGKKAWKTRLANEDRRKRDRFELHMDHPCEQGKAQEGRCAARRLDLCGSCQEPTTPDQVNAAAAATNPELGTGEQVRAWLAAGLVNVQVSDRMVEAAAHAADRFEVDLLDYGHLITAETPERGAYRLAGAVLSAAYDAKDLPPLPDLAPGPQTYRFTVTGGACWYGNLTPRRYEALAKQGSLTHLGDQLPAMDLPRDAHRILTTAHLHEHRWSLAMQGEFVQVEVFGLPSGAARWRWRGGRRDPKFPARLAVREALNLMTHVERTP